MVIGIELGIFAQIVTSASFWPKNWKYWNFDDDYVPNNTSGKVASLVVLI